MYLYCRGICCTYGMRSQRLVYGSRVSPCEVSSRGPEAVGRDVNLPSCPCPLFIMRGWIRWLSKANHTISGSPQASGTNSSKPPMTDVAPYVCSGFSPRRFASGTQTTFIPARTPADTPLNPFRPSHQRWKLHDNPDGLTSTASSNTRPLPRSIRSSSDWGSSVEPT
jgi:hypothetical protein